MAKTCPKCHANQPDSVEFCPTDGSRLQLLTAHKHMPTLVGHGDLSQQVGAALESEDDGNDATMAIDLSKLVPPTPPARAEPPRPATPPPPPAKTIPPIQRPGGTSQLKPVPVPVPMPVPVPVRAPSAATAPGSQPAAPVAPPAAPVSPAAAHTTTLARVLGTAGAQPVNLAVGRVVDLAELVQRPGRPSGAWTPAHIAYADPSGSGRPAWHAASPAAAYLAQYQPPDAAPGPAADVYVLACVLFECLTGKAPFRGANVQEIAKKQAMAAAPAVRQVKTDCDLPPSLEIELQRALKKRPGDRHASVAAFAEAIRNAVREDERATTALDVSEAAYLQQLLQGGDAVPGPPGVSGLPAPATAGKGSGAAPHVRAGAGQATGAAAAAGKPAVAAKATAPVKAVVPPRTLSAATDASGAAPGAAGLAEAATAGAAPAGNRTGLVVGLVLAGIALVGGAAFLMLRKPAEAPAPPATAPAVPDAPDVQEAPDVPAAPDVQQAPDVPQDVPPDVAEDVAPAAPVPAGKVKPGLRKVEPKPELKPEPAKPEPPKPEPKPEKKPDPNRPPVF